MSPIHSAPWTFAIAATKTFRRVYTRQAKVTCLPLPEPLHEAEAQEGPAEGQDGVSDGGLVRGALGPLHTVAEAVDAHLAADADQLRQLPRHLLKFFLRRYGYVLKDENVKKYNRKIGDGSPRCLS